MATGNKAMQIATSNKPPHSRYSLTGLPAEVLALVCDHLCELRDVDISVTDRSPLARPRLRYRYSDPFIELRPLLTTTKWARDVVRSWISRHIQFYADSTRFELIFQAFGAGNCLLVKSLRLELDENGICAGEEIWPGLLKTIVDYLPNLKQLVVWTCSASRTFVGGSPQSRRRAALWRTPTADDRRVAVWKFAAFLASRHTNLGRMTVWRSSSSDDTTFADSIVSRVMLDNGTSRHEFIKDTINCFRSVSLRQKPNATTQSDILLPEYEVLDTVLIRRTKWDTIADLPASDFYLPTHAQGLPPTYQRFHPHDIYITFADQRSFATKDLRTQQGWLRRTNDELIELCDSYVSRINLSSEEHLQRFFEDADTITKMKLDLERQLKEARDELGTMADDLSNLQRRYDWAVSDRDNAVNALHVQTNSVQEDRLARQYSGLARFGLDDWYRGTRARRW